MRSNNFFAYESEAEKTYLLASGCTEFEDFWQLPKEFVEPVNYRRGGWSGASKLVLHLNRNSGSETRHYFVKRQENQFRYSFRHPWGALTYHYEVAAIRRNQILDLPRMDIAGWGMRKAGTNHQGIILSRKIEYPALSQINAAQWEGLEPILEKAGHSLLNMHGQHIQHGALYPEHFFIDLSSGQIHLIDFERSRIRRSVYDAIARDLQQLIKHLAHMPEFALYALLAPYMPRYEELIQTLMQKFRKQP